MLTRLDNLVLVLAPVVVGRYTGNVGQWSPDARKNVARDIVELAHEIETAIADEELRQMQPPPGHGIGGSMEVEEMLAQMMPMFETVFRNQNRVTLAGAALRGLLSHPEYQKSSPEVVADHAVALADAVLARLERTVQ